MTIEELNDILAIDENYRIERTVSTGNMDKFQEAICAFANDLPGKRQKGYLLIGVYDDGKISGLKVDDALMKKISGIRSDGNIMFGKYPKFFMPGAYIQFVHFKGNDNGGAILNERRFEGCLYKVLPQIDNFIRDGIITKRPISISVLKERNVTNYPFKAIHELMMNACMHRDYQSNMPTRLYQYDRHIEIMNPGGLYGQARPENFPHVNDYRNNVVAEIMKTFDYVNMFNHGITEVQDALRTNDNPPAEFNVNLVTAFSVILKDEAETYEESIEKVNLDIACSQLILNLAREVKVLIASMKDGEMTASELQLGLQLGPQLGLELGQKSQRYFKKVCLYPALELKLIAQTHPESPRHPRQKYYLTELGKQLRAMLKGSIM